MSGEAGVHYNDRVLALGMTQSGKSEFLNHLVTPVAVQKVVVDTKHEFVIPDVEPVSDVAAIDWREPLIHYQDSTSQPAEFDELFEQLLRRPGRRVVVVHELGDLCAHQPSRTDPNVIGYFTKGQGLGKGLFGGSQRPRMLPSHAYTEATHFFIFAKGGLSFRDLPDVAQEMRMRPEQLAAELDELRGGLGEHAFLWWDRRSGELAHCEPLAEHVRAQTIVERRQLA